MTTPLTPLDLPARDTDWESWFTARCDDQLARARDLVTRLKTAAPENGLEALALWNDVNLAMANAFAVASLLAFLALTGVAARPRWNPVFHLILIEKGDDSWD